MKKHIVAAMILATTIVIAFGLISAKRTDGGGELISEDGVYFFGDVRVCMLKREIRFKGQVSKNEGRVQHLVYLDGYKWLKQESAIVSLCLSPITPRQAAKAAARLIRWPPCCGST